MTDPITSSNDRDLISYAFMAALNNRGKDLMGDVYMPMLKRAISHYSSAMRGGKDSDAKSAFYAMYGLDVPTYTIRRMLMELDGDLSRREKSETGFKVFEKGKSFTVSQFSFTAEETRYQAEMRNANALNAAFVEFQKDTGTLSSPTPPLSDFITQNRKKLAAFFDKNHRLTSEPPTDLAQFIPHASFFQLIADRNQALYEVAQDLFVGSVIAAYLESGLDLSPKFRKGTTFFLDTQFVLRSLDIQQEDETRPALEVLDMIQNSGAHTVVLDVTIGEIEQNLKAAIDHFSDNPLIAEIDNRSIINACFRKKKTRTGLELFLATFSQELQEVAHATTRKVPAETKTSAEKSKEHLYLRRQRSNPANALHDIICIFHVRDTRGGAVMSYQKANAWFVSSNPNLYASNLANSAQGTIPEVITPDELASLLWLQNPSALSKAVARVGIEELVAQAMTSSLAPVETLSELHSNLKKYTSITAEQYAILATSLATRSVESLRCLNSQAHSDAAAFTSQVLEIILQEKQRADSTMQVSLETAENARNLQQKYEAAIQRIADIERELFATCGIFFWIFYTYAGTDFLWQLFKTVAGLGGLWSFATMCINLWKLWRQRATNT